MLRSIVGASLRQEGGSVSQFVNLLSDGFLGLVRSTGETSTSYAHTLASAGSLMQSRSMSGKAKAKGKKDAAAAPPPPAAKAGVHPGTLLYRKRVPPADVFTTLSAEQKSLGKSILPPPPEPVEGAEPTAPSEFTSLKQLGLPLTPRDVSGLLHKSLSNLMGQQTHIKPYVFSNLFQSASATAEYVASALEHGQAWSKVERFFLSSVEGDTIVRGMRVQVRGRLGRKAGKASRKVWEWGDVNTRNLREAVDYGQATALTRMGALGVKVWIRYNPGAVPDLNFRKSTSFTMPLTKILAAPRTPLPYRSSAAWWNVPGPLQPLASRTWEAFTPDYKQQLDNAVSTAAATGSAAVGKGSTSVMRYLKELRLPTTRMSHPTDVSHFNLYYYWKLRKGGAGAAVANGSSGVAVMGRQPMELRALQQRPLHLLLDERAKSAARSFLRRHAARAASLAKISGSQAAQGRREPDGVAAARVLLRGPTSAHRLRALKGPLPLAQ